MALLVVIGLAFVTLLVVIINVVSNANYRLRTTGISAPGNVVAIADEDNQSNWSVMACALLLIVGMALFGSGCLLGIRRLVRRKRFARAQRVTTNTW